MINYHSRIESLETSHGTREKSHITGDLTAARRDVSSTSLPRLLSPSHHLAIFIYLVFPQTHTHVPETKRSSESRCKLIHPAQQYKETSRRKQTAIFSWLICNRDVLSKQYVLNEVHDGDFGLESLRCARVLTSTVLESFLD
jgi:hypothetical protein